MNGLELTITFLALLSLATSALAVEGFTTRTSIGTTYAQHATFCPATGMLYFTMGPSYQGNLLYRVNITGNATGTPLLLAGQPGSSATSGNDGVGTLATLTAAVGLVTLNEMCTTLYFGDYGAAKIRKVNLSNVTVSSMAGGAASLVGTGDGVGTNVYMYGPRGVALSRDGSTLYFTVEHAVRKLDLATGNVATIAGINDQNGLTNVGPRTVDGFGSAAEFQTPSGITVYDDDTLLVTESDGSSTVRRVTISTGQVQTVVGVGQDWGSTDGVGTDARLDTPTVIYYYAPRDTAYVVEQVKPWIRKIVMSTLNVTTIPLTGDFIADGAYDATGWSYGLSDVALDPAHNRALLLSSKDTSHVYFVQLDLSPLPKPTAAAAAAAAPAASRCAAATGGCISLSNGAVMHVQSGASIVVN